MAHLNPLEKEFLIRQFKLNGRIKLSDFCTLHNVSDAAFRKWLKQYEEGGLEGLARDGYYKWKNRKPSDRDINREKMVELVKTIHENHRTHGYRWTAAYIRINERMDISDNYAYMCFRFLGVKSETRHQVRYRPRKVRDKYPNRSSCIQIKAPYMLLWHTTN